jgi:uncharacterized protein (DUF2141 family)
MDARLSLAGVAFALVLVAMVPPADETAKKPRYASIVFQVKTDPDRGGEVLCALYRDERNWLTETTFRDAATDAGDKWATCVFPNVPRGKYAIAALHDEDGDGEMDKNFLGLPLEGYAASRDAHLKGFGAPDWEDAVFRHRSKTTVQRAQMKY